MKLFLNILFLLLFFCEASGCGGGKNQAEDSSGIVVDSIAKDQTSVNDENFGIDYSAMTVKTRYEVPDGFHRVEGKSGSFAEFLQNLPLKPKDYPTHLYDGTVKEKKIATSVIDLDVDSLGLERSIGAIVRLWSEYLYRSGQFDKIGFYFSDGFRCDYSKWAQGYRLCQLGAGSEWYKATDEDYSYPTFREYLLAVYPNIDLESLYKGMEDAAEDEFGIGTVIISTKPQQHVALVVDMIKMNDSQRFRRNDIGILVAQGGDVTQEIEIIRGNWDELDLFPKIGRNYSPYGNLWITSNKGERRIAKQGGRILCVDEFIEKKLKNFKL